MALQLPRRSMLQMVAAFVAGGCAAPLNRALAAGKDTATIGWPNDVGSWDPNQRFTPDAQAIFKAVFDQPLDQDPQLKLIPHLIKTWNLAAGRLEHGGRAARRRDVPQRRQMTTEDFRYTFFERPKSGLKLDTANSWRKVQDIVIESPTKATMKFNVAGADRPAMDGVPRQLRGAEKIYRDQGATKIS